jgi:hypothetical protein
VLPAKLMLSLVRVTRKCPANLPAKYPPALA